MNELNISFEITELFGSITSPNSNLSLSDIKKLQTSAWQGDLCSLSCRPICWRIFLRLISNNKSNWKNELIKQVEDYNEIKKNIIPSFDKVSSSVDPLQSFLNINDNADSSEGNWQSYYKSMELSNFIKGDLDRLYMAGIDDEYFQSDKRRSQLLSILLVWSLQNKNISYRQGMHEIIGPILMCVEAESDAWILENKNNSTDKHILSESFISKNIEAYSYWLFNRIMVELKPLYDPTPTASVKSSEPAVVHYCTKIQEHFLRDLDPVLCKHLEDNFIPAQLYGMRWSRLLLGREFPVSHSHCLKLWDYMFATVRDDDEFIPIYNNDNNNNNNESSSNNNILSNNENLNDLSPSMQQLLKSRYGPYSPLLSALGDFILAMLLNIRDDLVEADSSDSMRLLLRYPEQINIRPILDYADMIRRGVLATGAHIYTPPKVVLKPAIKQKTISTPSWLSKSQSVSIISKSSNVLQNIGQKVEKIVTNVAIKSNDTINHSIIDPLKEFNDKTVSFVENATELLTSNNYFINEDGINCCKFCKNQLNQINNSKNAISLNVEKEINIDNNKNNIFSSNVSDNILSPFINESSSSSWFPLSMSKSAVKSERKNRPSSGGFDLPIRKNFGFNDDDHDDLTNDNTINRGGNILSKKSNVDILLDKNNLIGNRLLDMADDILKPVSSANIEAISDKQKELNNIEFNKNVARKLRILADVLGGLSSLDEYDEKFHKQNTKINNSYIKTTSSIHFSSNSDKNIKKIITDDNPLLI